MGRKEVVIGNEKEWRRQFGSWVKAETLESNKPRLSPTLPPTACETLLESLPSLGLHLLSYKIKIIVEFNS